MRTDRSPAACCVVVWGHLMPSQTVATRSSGGRCAACNQPATAWLCEACGFGSQYYSARFNDDTRPTSATMVARRNLYPKSTSLDYADLGTPCPLNLAQRIAIVHDRVEAASSQLSKENTRLLSRELMTQARAYNGLATSVDANRIARERAWGPYDVLNRVLPVDPRRVCDECIAHRRHRQGCVLIEMEGPYVGGYPDDGTQQRTFKFAELKAPKAHWLPVQHRRHARAVKKRWDAFTASWMHIGLDVFTRAVSAASPVGLPVKFRRKQKRDKPLIGTGHGPHT